MGTPRNGPWLKWLLGGVAVGVVLVGVLAYAMTATDQRPFCASCHIMQEAAVTTSWVRTPTVPNECHAPTICCAVQGASGPE
ncbi:MAG: NapC/NirT family cytochrome c [Desulfovibrio fairfieldensis]